MFHQEFEPPEILRDSIKCFWHNTRQTETSLPDFEVMPDGYAEIIFHFGSDISVWAGQSRQPLPSPFLMGLLDHPLRFHSPNNLQIIGIRCYPWAVFDLLHLPSGKGGLHVFEHPIAQLQPNLDQLVKAGLITDALNLITQYLLVAHDQVAPSSMLHKAGLAMSAANGTLPVSQVAAAAHATVRTLERNFKQSSGYTVKDVSGVMRFEQVRNALWHQPHVSLSTLAHQLGYTDQSHLSREFKRYSGATPAAFARQAQKNRLIAGSDFVAFIQA